MKKSVSISIEECILAEVDEIAVKEETNRSDIVREALRLYLKERKQEIRKFKLGDMFPNIDKGG